jgi:hypothetical protein
MKTTTKKRGPLLISVLSTVKLLDNVVFVIFLGMDNCPFRCFCLKIGNRAG